MYIKEISRKNKIGYIYTAQLLIKACFRLMKKLKLTHTRRNRKVSIA